MSISENMKRAVLEKCKNTPNSIWPVSSQIVKFCWKKAEHGNECISIYFARQLVSEYIGPFGKSWLRMRSTWQTNWVCAQVHERNFGTTSKCNYSYLYRSGSQNCLAIITIVLKSFWLLNSKKNFSIEMAVSHFIMKYGWKRKLSVLISDNLRCAKLYFGL